MRAVTVLIFEELSDSVCFKSTKRMFQALTHVSALFGHQSGCANQWGAPVSNP